MKRTSTLIVLLLALGSGLAFAQQPVNEVQLNGTATSTGNGVSGTGVQRVVIASDQTAFAVNATLQAAATTAIGVVRTADGAGNLLTSNSSTYTAKFGLDSNLLGTLDTAFTTPGFVDIKGADGNVFVRQTTGSNLHVVADTGSTTAVTQATASNLNATVVQATGTNLHVVCDSGCAGGGTTSLVPATSGGLTLSHTVTAATTNATSTKGTAGQVYQICINNGAAYPVYLKLYNNATAPTVGTTTVVKTIVAQAGLPSCVNTEEGLAFGTGIAWAVTKNLVDTDTTAVALNDATVELAYK
jgi:hypothetical protein